MDGWMGTGRVWFACTWEVEGRGGLGNVCGGGGVLRRGEGLGLDLVLGCWVGGVIEGDSQGSIWLLVELLVCSESVAFVEGPGKSRWLSKRTLLSRWSLVLMKPKKIDSSKRKSSREN